MFDSLSFRLSFRCGRTVRHATVNREAQVRFLPSELQAPVVERAMTPDSQSGSCGFEPRRGYRPIVTTAEATSHSRHHVRHRDVVRRVVTTSARSFASACRGVRPPRRLWAPEIAGSTPAGQTKALACDADQRLCRLCRRGRPLRRRGEAVPASLMSSRPWVRIPPALLHSGT